MADAIHWTCPYCGRDATIRDDDFHAEFYRLDYSKDRTKHGYIGVYVRSVVCPNPDCLEITLEFGLYRFELAGGHRKATNLSNHGNSCLNQKPNTSLTISRSRYARTTMRRAAFATRARRHLRHSAVAAYKA